MRAAWTAVEPLPSPDGSVRSSSPVVAKEERVRSPSADRTPPKRRRTAANAERTVQRPSSPCRLDFGGAQSRASAAAPPSVGDGARVQRHSIVPAAAQLPKPGLSKAEEATMLPDDALASVQLLCRPLCWFGKECNRIHDRRHFGPTGSHAHPPGLYSNISSSYRRSEPLQEHYEGDPDWPPPLPRREMVSPPDSGDEGQLTQPPDELSSSQLSDLSDHHHQQDCIEQYEWTVRVDRTTTPLDVRPTLCWGSVQIGPIPRRPDWSDKQAIFSVELGRDCLESTCHVGWVLHLSRAQARLIGRWDERLQCVDLFVQHVSEQAWTGTTVDGVLLEDGSNDVRDEVPLKNKLGLLAEGRRSQPSFERDRLVLDITEVSDGGLTDTTARTSFDQQYRRMLRTILRAPRLTAGQRRGPTREAQQSSQKIVIDLRGTDDCAMPLPGSSLRWINKHPIPIELLWYLRGDDNIAYLQQHGVRFWDADADEHGFLGMNYGLMTNFDGKRGPGIVENNQLEKVIRNLCAGKIESRNNIVTLCNPDASTRQAACTSSFQVKGNSRTNTLDMTVNQRSSDVCIGLPFDIVIWSILLHLICREVELRTRGHTGAESLKLSAGTLTFEIVSAHIYLKNEGAAVELLKRAIIPAETEQPHLRIDDSKRDTSMFMLEPGDLGISGWGKGTFHPTDAGKDVFGRTTKSLSGFLQMQTRDSNGVAAIDRRM